MSKTFPRLAFVLMLAGSLALAQDFGDRFARATITQNDKPLLLGTIFEDPGGSLIVKGAPLADLIARAYDIEPYRVVDAPEWAYASHQYDIEAVPPPAELVESDEAAMLQTLLAERFRLQVRRETREVTMLVLDVDRGKQEELALKLAALEEEAGAVYSGPAPGPGQDPTAATAIFRMGIPVLTSTQTIVSSLARSRGEPVRDLTGANELYLPVTGIRADGKLFAMPAADSGVLYELSGLILEERAVPLEVLVVTSIDHPVLAQIPDTLSNRFARATITRNEKPLLMGTIFMDTADHLIVQGAPLADVIARAWSLERYRVVDAPEWVYEDHVYDIDAVPPPTALVVSDEALMLQALLADRFKLQTRRETREVTMLVLDVADPARQRELEQATPRFDPDNLPTVLPLGTPVRASTQALIRGRDEAILDLTQGSVYLASNPYIYRGPMYKPLGELVEQLRESGIALEERTVSLDVLAVTHVEHPVLDLVDR